MAAKLRKSRKPRSLPAPVPATDSPSEVYEKSLAKVAERLGVNPHTLESRRKHGQIPGTKGAWPLIAIAASLLDTRQLSEEKAERDRREWALSYETKQVALEYRKLELAKEKKELVSPSADDDVLQAVGLMHIERATQAVDALLTSVADEIVGKSREDIDRIIHERREEFSR